MGRTLHDKQAKFNLLLKKGLRAGDREMTQWVFCVLGKREDSSLIPEPM